MGDILVILTGAAILTAVGLLIARHFYASAYSYERQQLRILLLFLSLAVIPLLIFVLTPLAQTLFVPYPFLYSLFLLAPSGYFFVFHRQGRLALDSFFSRVLTFFVLVLAVGMAYATGVYLLEALFAIQLSELALGGMLLTLFTLAFIGQRGVQAGVDGLIYGRDDLPPAVLQAARARLAAQPEPRAVAAVVADLAARMHVPQTAVLLKSGAQFRSPDRQLAIPASAALQKINLRARDGDLPAGCPAWVELSLPLAARGDAVGLLWLARPAGGYFHARQLAALSELADLLALGLLAINLVTMIQALSGRTLYEKERQRQQIATEIHNEPLHTLTAVLMQLGLAPAEEGLGLARQSIRQATRDLRRIIADLRPPALKQSVEWIARQLARAFAEEHPQIDVDLRLDLQSERPADPQTKAAFYYILTEALHNVSKHARAARVTVELAYDGRRLRCTVADDGVGRQVGAAPLGELLAAGHLGIADMHRWATVGGGQLQITGEWGPGDGRYLDPIPAGRRGRGRVMSNPGQMTCPRYGTSGLVNTTAVYFDC